MAWELANELRCEACVGTTAMVDTVSYMAQVAKAAFPRHLIADGGEGFDDAPERYPSLSNLFPVSGRMGASYHRLAAIEALDLMSYHFYPRAWGLDAGLDAAVWIERHDAIAREGGKVAYLGEYGLSARGQGSEDSVRALIYDAWLERLFASTGACWDSSGNCCRPGERTPMAMACTCLRTWTPWVLFANGPARRAGTRAHQSSKLVAYVGCEREGPVGVVPLILLHGCVFEIDVGDPL